KNLSQTLFFTNRNIVQSTGGSFDRIGIHGSRAFLRNDDGIHAYAFGCTCNRTKVADVADTIQNQKKRISALFVNLWQYVFDRVKFNRRKKSKYTLMVFPGQTV